MKIIREWLRTNPVRTWLYPVLSAVVAVLLARGILDADTAALVSAVLVALAGAGAVEAARARVTPYADPQTTLDELL